MSADGRIKRRPHEEREIEKTSNASSTKQEKQAKMDRGDANRDAENPSVSYFLRCEQKENAWTDDAFSQPPPIEAEDAISQTTNAM